MAHIPAAAVVFDPAPRILPRVLPRILIVDDSVVARTMLARMVTDADRFVVAATVPDARRALAVLAHQSVDLILLDIEMPGVDGLSALPDLIAAGNGARVLIVSSSCGDGAAATIRALALGAADTLVKPEAGLSRHFATALVDKIDRLTQREAPLVAHTTVAMPIPGAFDVIAIGASTGGIHALGQLLGAIPRSFARPILITQHLPASFTPYFAAQIALLAGRPCDVAADHMRLRADRVVIAPGDAHLTAVALPDGEAAIRLSGIAVANGNLPSVDPMLGTLAGVYGKRMMAVILSGMGRDGLDGARRVRACGGTVVVQDPASSVVWGMPGAVVEAGLANAVLTPTEIGELIAGGRRMA